MRNKGSIGRNYDEKGNCGKFLHGNLQLTNIDPCSRENPKTLNTSATTKKVPQKATTNRTLSSILETSKLLDSVKTIRKSIQSYIIQEK